uniref:type IV pilus modification PilV family protein n=1 Tax=Candidatus Electronema sp. TaxID=2698783 RepID=UPI0040573459
MSARRAQKQEAAFTLLEVMVAVAVIAMSFTALLASQSQSLSLAAASRFETTASLLARQKLTELAVADFASGGSGDFAEGFAEYRWQAEVSELTEDETGIKGSGGMLKLIELTVSREERETFSVRTLVMAKIEPVEGGE